MDSLQEILREADVAMEKAYKHLEEQIEKSSIHRVNPKVLHNIKVDHYGVASPLEQLANISIENASTLVLKPWEKKLLTEIERAIVKQNNYGFTTRNTGEVIYVSLPPLTEDTRKKFAKQIDLDIEQGKVVIRNSRKKVKDAIKQIKSEDEARNAEQELQKITDRWIEAIKKLHEEKKKQVMAT